MKALKRSFFIIFAAFFVLSISSTNSNIEAKEQVIIYRDNYGVPHIYAQTIKGLFTAWGYAVAKDRLFEIEVMRASVWGRTAEFCGAGPGNKYIQFDKATRQNGFSVEEVWQEIKSLEKEYQIMLESYANGINMCIEETLANPSEKLPYEFQVNGITTIEPWTAADVAQIFIGSMGLRYNDTSNELRNAALLDYFVGKFGPDAYKVFNDILPLGITDAPTTCPVEDVSSKDDKGVAKKITASISRRMYAIRKGIQEVAEKEMARNELIISVLNDLGLPSKLGSYEWMVGGGKTEGKETLFLNGPQHSFYVPAYLHEVGLHGAGYDLVGTTSPGYLAVLFGHNNNIVWGSTAGVGDNVDMFVLKLQGDPYHYVYNGQIVEMKKRTETIRVKGGAPQSVDVHRSVYGPVSSWSTDGKYAFTKKRAWEGSCLKSWTGWLDCTKAHNFSQFAQGASKMALSINWGYADKMGNIGYIHNGRYPIRHPDVDVRLPSPGTGEYDWMGYHPFSWNPKCTNPKRGFMANWNNRPSIDFPSGDRVWNTYQGVYRIIDDLKSKSKVTFQDMKDINKDIGFIHLQADYFLGHFLNNIGGGLDPQMTEAINKLTMWDKYQVDVNDDGKYDAPGLTIWNRWWSEAIKATLLDELGSTYYNDTSLFLHVLQGSASNIPLSRDYLNAVSVSVMLQNTLKTALSALQIQFGTNNMDLWLTPRREHTFSPNNFLGIPQAPIPVRNLRQYMNRGTENHIVKLEKGEVSGVNINPPGQSGFVDPDGIPSPHYADQLDMFEDYKGYKPMLRDIGQVLSNLESTEYITIP